MNNSQNNGKNGKERRSAPRIPASDVISHKVAGLATGQKVELMDFSMNGAILVKSMERLMPGSFVSLKLDMSGTAVNLAGRILRCKVADIKEAKVQYEAAIILDGGFPLPLVKKLRAVLDGKPGSASSPSRGTGMDTTILPKAAAAHSGPTFTLSYK